MISVLYNPFKKQIKYLGGLSVVGDESGGKACATSTKGGGGWLPDVTRMREDLHYIIQHEKEFREIQSNNNTLVSNAVVRLFSWQ